MLVFISMELQQMRKRWSSRSELGFGGWTSATDRSCGDDGGDQWTYVESYVAYTYQCMHIHIVWVSWLAPSSFSALTLLVRWQERHPVCKSPSVGIMIRWWWYDWSFACRKSSSLVSYYGKISNGLTLWNHLAHVVLEAWLLNECYCYPRKEIIF